MLNDLCFEVIQKCPNNCLFCSSCSSIDKENIISFELFKKTIDYLIDTSGIEEISLSGGEPLLHPNILEMIQYCKSKNIRVVLFTSGIKKRVKTSQEEMARFKGHELRIMTEINKDEYSSLTKEDVKLLESIGLDKIVFDFQGYILETYNHLMNTKNMMIHVLNSIIYCGLSSIETDIHFIPLKSNYKELIEIVELLNIAEVKNISILNFVPQGRGKENSSELMLNGEEMAEFKKICFEAKKLFQGNMRIGIPLLSNDDHLCTAGYDKLVIKYDGTVLPCPTFKEFDLQVLNQIGIDTPNINTDLNKILIKHGTRKRPLCKEIYNFDKNMI